jgi:hypothetical protein
MIAGDFEFNYILKICGFLSNFYGRALFIIYCGVNMLLFSSNPGSSTFGGIASVCGWICIGFGICLACMKICTKEDSLIGQGLNTYMEKQGGKEQAKASNEPENL